MYSNLKYKFWFILICFKFVQIFLLLKLFVVLRNVILLFFIDKKFVCVSWMDGISIKFYNMWLRDYCCCGECYNFIIYQKEFNILDVFLDIEFVDVVVDMDNFLLVIWVDNYKICFDGEWLKYYSYGGLGLVGVIRWLQEKQKFFNFFWDKKVIELKFFCFFVFDKVIFD